jgi:hypothetical protein
LTRELKPSSEKKTVFSTNGAGTSSRRMRIDLFPCTKVKSKWIKDLYITPETLKFIEDKVGQNLKHKVTGEKFLNRTAIACAVRSSMDKWDLKIAKLL